MKCNGSELLLECLIEQGVDTIFGYPGGTILNIYDALYGYKDRIRHILTSHEQGAAHAADGYARATGRVGVCLATSGPGATNLVTGIATAYMDSSPIVAITGNVAKPLLGKDSFQEIDISGVTCPITKHNLIVNDISKLAPTIRRAFQIAKQGRPGPVLVDITKDVTAEDCEYLPPDEEQNSPAARLDGNQIEQALSMIRACSKPFVLCGGGLISSGASAEFAEFVQLIDSPYALTTMALGGMPCDDERLTGMVGMHGRKASNLSVMNCDLLIAMGTRFSDRVTGSIKHFAGNAKILHIDIDPSEINKNVPCSASVIGDLKQVLSRFNSELSPQSHPEWNKQIQQYKLEYPLTYQLDCAHLTPQFVLHKLGEVIDGQAIVTTDVGQHQMWSCQLLPHRHPRYLITSGGLGTMGFGMGAAIGAAAGNPGKRVFHVTGDGCFRMNCIELATAVTYNLPITTVIINNHVLGMVRQWQNFFYEQRYSSTTFGPSSESVDFVRLAEAFHAKAFQVSTPAEVEPAFRASLECSGPVVINVETGTDDKVFPMVPAGMPIDDFWVEEE